jgi:ABC-2 type transport system ATP-binding protein
VEAERLCDIVGVIRRGRLAALGPPSSLRPSDSTAVRVTGSGIDQLIADAAAAVPGVLEATVVDGALEVRLMEGARAAPLVAMLVERGVAIEEVRRDRQSLEDAFLELVSDDAGTRRPAGDGR